MKEVQIQSWCDGEHAMKMPANREQEISLRPGKRYTVDLCESCYSAMVSPLEALVHEHGVPVASNTAAPKRSGTTGMRPGKGPEKCPVAGCNHGSSSENGLKQHMLRHHPGQKLSDYR
jgi:hypothetical protein